MATTNAFCLASPPLVRICLHGDLQRFGRRISLYVNTAAEAIRALSQQVPGFRCQMNEGWYQIRIAGEDTAPDQISPRLHEPLNPGDVIHLVPRAEGAKSGGVFQAVLGVALVAAAIWMPGIGIAASNIMFSMGSAMALGGVAQMLVPKAKTPEYKST
ncbi:TPA: tail assembly protein, partial [Escherichia coli]